MTSFSKWCAEDESKMSNNTVTVLSADPGKLDHAKKLVAAAVPDFYTNPSRVAELLQKLKKPGAAKYVAEKLPLTKSIRSGDLGEILCNAYVLERTSFTRGIRRLRWKDHREMSMRGEDVLAFTFDAKGRLKILKAEVKSRAAMSSTVIGTARKALSAFSGLPAPHALSFVADRLKESGGDVALADAIDLALLDVGIRPAQVTHMLFTFSANDPSNLLKDNLTKYAGTVKQNYVGLRVKTHQEFIKDVFELVGK